MSRTVRRFCRSESASTALEYAVVAAAVSVMIIACMEGLGLNIAATLAKSASMTFTAAPPP